jgi:hypothetical protein
MDSGGTVTTYTSQKLNYTDPGLPDTPEPLGIPEPFDVRSTGPSTSCLIDLCWDICPQNCLSQ